MHALLFESFHDELEKIAYLNPLNMAIDATIGAVNAEDPVKGAIGGAVGGTLGGLAGEVVGDAATRSLKGVAPRASKYFPMAGLVLGSTAGAVSLARAIGGKKDRSPRAPKRRAAAQTAWMNRPENISKINSLLERNARKMHNKPLNQLNEQQWQASYDRSLQTMTGLYQQSKEKRAYVDPSGRQQRVMGANYLSSGVVPANKALRMTRRRGMRNPIHGSTAAVSQPAMPKTAEVTYRGVTFPGYNKPIASNRKGKKKMVLVKKGDKVRIIHFGQKGYQDFTQHKDKARRKNYLTRSAGIRNKSGQLTKDDPFSPNYWARRKLW
jgi:hypothetical protein